MAVTPSDIAVELGRSTPLDDATEAQWQRWISKALALVGRAAIQREVVVGTLDPSTVDYVVTESVVAHVRAWRPDAASRYSVQVDDGQVDRTYFKDAGSLSIGDDLLALLFPGSLSGVFTVTPYFEPDAPTAESWL